MTALAYSLKTAARESSLSESHLDRAIKAGQLRIRKSSEDGNGEPVGRIVILHDDLAAYLKNLPEA